MSRRRRWTRIGGDQSGRQIGLTLRRSTPASQAMIAGCIAGSMKYSRLRRSIRDHRHLSRPASVRRRSCRLTAGRLSSIASAMSAGCQTEIRDQRDDPATGRIRQQLNSLRAASRHDLSSVDGGRQSMPSQALPPITYAIPTHAIPTKSPVLTVLPLWWNQRHSGAEGNVPAARVLGIARRRPVAPLVAATPDGCRARTILTCSPRCSAPCPSRPLTRMAPRWTRSSPRSARRRPPALEPVTDGRLGDPAFEGLTGLLLRPDGVDEALTTVLEGWRVVAAATERATKQALPGPYSVGMRAGSGTERERKARTLAVAEALAEIDAALAEAGCPLVEIEESDAQRLTTASRA